MRLCSQYVRAINDACITNRDEIEESENLTQSKKLMPRPKLKTRTAEDTFITNVNEVVESENTTYLKNNDKSLAEKHYEVEEHCGNYSRD